MPNHLQCFSNYWRKNMYILEMRFWPRNLGTADKSIPTMVYFLWFSLLFVVIVLIQDKNKENLCILWLCLLLTEPKRNKNMYFLTTFLEDIYEQFKKKNSCCHHQSSQNLRYNTKKHHSKSFWYIKHHSPSLVVILNFFHFLRLPSKISGVLKNHRRDAYEAAIASYASLLFFKTFRSVEVRLLFCL